MLVLLVWKTLTDSLKHTLRIASRHWLTRTRLTILVFYYSNPNFLVVMAVVLLIYST